MAKKPTKTATPAYPVNPALEAAVIAHAEDDTPRLVYADWLDENGDPDRAAFIRTQVALWDKNPADEDYVEVAGQHNHLYELMRNRWLGLTPPLPDCLRFTDDPGEQLRDSEQAGYHRGFPYLVGTRFFPDETLRDALTNVARTTTVRGLEIYSDDPRGLRTVMGDSVAGQFTALRITNQDADATGSGGTIPLLLDSPMCANLLWLNLRNVATPTDADFLANTKAFHKLRRFEGGLDCAAAPMKRVVSSPCFAGLSRVCLDFGAGDAPAAIQGLAQLPNLHTLELSRVPAKGLAAFSKSSAFRTLGRLKLDSAALHGDGAKSLAKAKFPNLRALEVSECSLTDKDVELLAGSALFDRLRSFCCWDTFGNKGLTAIVDSDCASHLRCLDVRVRTASKSALAGMVRRMTGLISLRMSDYESGIATTDVAWFLANLATPRLRFLSLGLHLDDNVAGIIALNPAFAELKSLELWGNASYQPTSTLSAKGILALLRSPHLRRLERLLLRSDQTISGVATIQELLADRHVMPALRQIDVGGHPNPQTKLQTALKAARPKLDVR